MVSIYAGCFGLYAVYKFVVWEPMEGWWVSLGLPVCVFLLEIWLWINVGLPRAVKRGSEEFKKAYYREG